MGWTCSPRRLPQLHRTHAGERTACRSAARGGPPVGGDPRRMLLVCWNLAGRVKALETQAQRLLDLDADLLCLQETTPSTLPLWRERLAQAGYHVCHADPAKAAAARPLMALSASRTPLRALA